MRSGYTTFVSAAQLDSFDFEFGRDHGVLFPCFSPVLWSSEVGHVRLSQSVIDATLGVIRSLLLGPANIASRCIQSSPTTGVGIQRAVLHAFTRPCLGLSSVRKFCEAGVVRKAGFPPPRRVLGRCCLLFPTRRWLGVVLVLMVAVVMAIVVRGRREG